jgi:hypothetical protein
VKHFLPNEKKDFFLLYLKDGRFVDQHHGMKFLTAIENTTRRPGELFCLMTINYESLLN